MWTEVAYVVMAAGCVCVLRLAKSQDAKCQNGYIGRDKIASKRRNWTY